MPATVSVTPTFATVIRKAPANRPTRRCPARHAECRGHIGSAGTKPHETGLTDNITYVRSDVHKATVSVAGAGSGRGGEVHQVGGFREPSNPLDLRFSEN